jgi:apolipoprotein N-acyltransferase
MKKEKAKGAAPHPRFKPEPFTFYLLPFTFYLLPAFSGLLLVLIQPPISLFFLAYVSLIPLLHSLKQGKRYHNFLSGFVCGVVSYLGLVYWVVVAMNRYGGINMFLSSLILLLLVLYLSLYSALFALSVPYLEEHISLPSYISAPIIWVLLEYLRSTALTGFPWSLLAHSQHPWLHLIQAASVTGTYFISFLIVSVNCIIHHAIKRKVLPLAFTSVILAFFAASIVFGVTQLTNRDEERYTAAIIQGNITQDIKWDDSARAKTIKIYYTKTLDSGKGNDLVIWPETALPLIYNEEKELSDLMAALPPRINAHVLFGTVSKDRTGRFYNSTYLLDKEGKVEGYYNKVHLVPFGEYTPLISYLPFLEKITATGSGFSPGRSHDPAYTRLGRIGILICYEGIFPYITNDTVRRGAQVLVNITNDAWYDRTSAAYQHFAFYIFRAIETDRYVLRAANTGISAIIDSRGRVLAKTPIFEELVLRGRFAIKDTETFYVRHGDYFVPLAGLYLAAFAALAHFRQRRQAAGCGS